MTERVLLFESVKLYDVQKKYNAIVSPLVNLNILPASCATCGRQQTNPLCVFPETSNRCHSQSDDFTAIASCDTPGEIL